MLLNIIADSYMPLGIGRSCVGNEALGSKLLIVHGFVLRDNLDANAWLAVCLNFGSLQAGDVTNHLSKCDHGSC